MEIRFFFQIRSNDDYQVRSLEVSKQTHYFLKKNPGRNSKYRFSEVFGRHVPFCMFEKIDWMQEVEAPVTVVVELEMLDQVRLHSKGLRDCSKFREWALEAQ